MKASPLRTPVASGARHRCEYCRTPEWFGIRYHVDHILSIKHGGDDDFEYLAYTCPFCNANKGTG